MPMHPATEPTPELLPCPFCGNAPRVKHGDSLMHISCDTLECPIDINFIQRTPEKAIAAWNQRAPSPVNAALVAAREGLLALLGECRLDHSGNCQAHFLGNPCEVANAKAALATLKQ